MRSTPQNKKLELLLKHKSCSRCMQTTHQVTDCKVDENASWLTHPECPKKHNPLVCPLKKVENSMATRTSTCSGDSDLGLPVAEDSHADADLVINLAEKAEVRDAAGRMHSVTAVHDHCSDSSWISSSLARSLPPTKRRRVTVPLHTIQGTTPFRTWQYHLQILVNNEYKSIKVYESPDIGTVQYDSALPSFLKKVFGCAIHLPEGSVDLLIGIREHALSPDTLAIKPAHGTVEVPNLKIYQSSLMPARRLICGSISSALIGGVPVRERTMFTQSELTKIITQDKGLDILPQLCDVCRNRSNGCSDCKLLNRPTSLKEMTETKLIKDNLFFDKIKKKVSCRYIPTFSSWAEIFPPRLKNDCQARKASQRLLRSLQKTGMMEQFQEVFENFIKEGIFVELTKEEMQDWEKEGGGVNYINFHHVLKEQTQAGRQKLRIVTNSSVSRVGMVDGKETQCSLNSCLPQGSVSFNQLEEVAINWLTAPVSLLLDVKKAYSNIKSCDGEEQNKHLRRMIWYKDPATDVAPEHSEEVTYAVSPAHYGDAISSCLLANTMLKISEDMADDGLKAESEKFLEFNFVDDEIGACKNLDEAFRLDSIFRAYLANYSMEMHEAIVPSVEGRHMSLNGVAVREPPEGEPEIVKTMGFRFSPYTDSYVVPIQKKFKESGGRFKMKIGVDLTPETVMALDRLTMRQIASFNASIFDLCGHLAPLKIFGKKLLARIMESPSSTSGLS